MKAAPKDYVVVNCAEDETKPKYKLIKVSSSNNGEVIGIDQKQPHIEREVVEVTSPKIILNLGQVPHPGVYLGLSTKSLYRRSLESAIGTVHILCGIKKAEFEIFKESADRFRDWLIKNKLDFILNDDVTLELVSSTGKYAGMYHTKGKKLANPKITFSYEKLFEEGASIDYVIAHEFGHHIQTLLGTSSKVQELQGDKNEVEGNKLSVSLELQADFYAGLWTHYNQKMNNILEPGDIEEALSAANAVGDDAIQSKMQIGRAHV